VKKGIKAKKELGDELNKIKELAKKKKEAEDAAEHADDEIKEGDKEKDEIKR
jgi:hypothetical protein